MEQTETASQRRILKELCLIGGAFDERGAGIILPAAGGGDRAGLKPGKQDYGGRGSGFK